MKKSKTPSLRFLVIFLFLTLAVLPGLIFVTLSWYQYEQVIRRDIDIAVSEQGEELDRQEVVDSALASLRSSGFIYFGAYVIMLVPTLLYFSNKLSSPLKQLEKKAEDMAHGSLAGEVAITKDKSWAFKELTALATAFESLRQRVVSSYQDLESEVAERTWDLHSKINQLTRIEQRIGNVNQQLTDAIGQVERQKVLLQDILDNMPVGVVITKKPNGPFEVINKKAEDLLGKVNHKGTTYSQKYQLYREDKVTLYPADKLPINLAFKTKKGAYVEDISIKKAGDTYINIYAQTSLIYGKAGEVELSIMIFDDITARKEIERQKSEFVSVVSHQLRTPLSAVRWFVELLLEGGEGNLNAEQKEYVENIYESNKRLISLVNDLLNVSRIEAGRVAIKPEPTDIVHLVKRVKADVAALLEQRSQTVNILAQELPKVSIDPKLIHEVVINLLSNASKYSPDNSEIKVTIEKQADRIEVSVIDQGLGIPARDQHKVFTKFFRADNVVKKETEGTGLGLYVVKQIVKASGGDIWFTSEENQGTTFTFSLPLTGSPKVQGEKSLI